MTIKQLRRELSRRGMSIRHYDLEYVPLLYSADGRPAYAASPHDGAGEPLRGAGGRPLIQLSDLAMQDLATAVTSVFHEIAHHVSYRAFGHGGTEAEAEQYGRRLYRRFARHRHQSKR